MASESRAKASDRKARSGTSRRSDSGGRTGSTGAKGPGKGAGKAKAESAYLAELQRAIARRKRFPTDAKRRGAEGTVTVSFVVHRDGRIRKIRIARSSGDKALDRAALDTLHRLGRFKPIPASIGRSTWALRVPIRFDLR